MCNFLGFDGSAQKNPCSCMAVNSRLEFMPSCVNNVFIPDKISHSNTHRDTRFWSLSTQFCLCTVSHAIECIPCFSVKLVHESASIYIISSDLPIEIPLESYRLAVLKSSLMPRWIKRLVLCREPLVRHYLYMVCFHHILPLAHHTDLTGRENNDSNFVYPPDAE